jgi:hypothetical protein
MPGMNTISVWVNPATWVRFGIIMVRFGTTVVELGITVVSDPLLPVCFCNVAVLPANVTLPELIFGEITPGVVISSSKEFHNAGYELKL